MVHNVKFVLANAISFTRIIVSVTLVLWSNIVFYNETYYLLLIAVAALSDFLDGYIARKFSLVSKLGAIIDYTSDKIFFSSVLFLLSFYSFIPAWLAILNITRDYVIMGIRINLSGRVEPVVPKMIGKVKTTLLYATLLLHPFSNKFLNLFLTVVTVLSLSNLGWYFFDQKYNNND